jgi:hypothetical protein
VAEAQAHTPHVWLMGDFNVHLGVVTERASHKLAHKYPELCKPRAAHMSPQNDDKADQNLIELLGGH